MEVNEVDMSGIKSQMFDLGKRVTELEGHVNISILEERITQFSKRMDGFEKNLVSVEQNMTAIRGDVSRIKDEINDVKVKMAEKMAELETNLTNKMIVMFGSITAILAGLMTAFRFL